MYLEQDYVKNKKQDFFFPELQESKFSDSET